MLDKIIDFSLRNRLSIVIGAILLVITGTIVTTRMDIDIFPELTAPTVVIMTEASGMAPEEVERLVTFPIETAVNGATSIRRVRSTSTMGFSIVFAEFDWGTDIYKARQTIAERLIQANEMLPEGIDKPVIAPQTSLLGEMMIIALESDSLNPMDLRTMADWTVAPRLLSVGGVAQVTVIGGDIKEYQVLADPYRMDFYKITLNELVNTCKEINLNTSGGFINQYGNKYIVRGMAKTNEISDLGNSIIKISKGLPLRLRDVADVEIGKAPAIGTASYRGRSAVLLTVTRQPDANTVHLSEDLNKVIADIQGNTGSSVIFHSDIYNQASFINTSVRNVMKALLEGGIFVVLILFFFLFNTRTTFISLLAMPLSLLVTIITLKIFGYTINTMSLGGMAIAIGSLVDDAIIDVENIYKQLRKNVVLPAGKKESSLVVVYRASSEVRSSIWNATLIIIITFVPLFFLGDLEGRMLRPLGISFIVSLFASLIVAVTITPVLSSYLLTSEKRLMRAVQGSWTERNLGAVYRKALQYTLGKSKIVIGVTLLVFIFSIILLTTTGSSFLPSFNEGALTVNISLPPGISLEESARTGIKAQEILLGIPEITSISCKTGRAELAEHFFGENMSELDVPFVLSGRSREDFFADVRERLRALPGASIEVGQPITHRMDRMLSGTQANIAIKLFGDDLNELYRTANQIRSEISDIHGIGDLNVEQLVETPQIKIKPNREMLARYGIDINSFNSFIKYSIAGETVSDVYEEEKRFPLVLRYNDEARGMIEGIRNTMIDSYDGKKVPLSFVADIVSSSGPYSINRENVKRKIVISVNTAGRDVGSVVKDIKERIGETIILPDDYHIEYGGQFESAENATKRLIAASIVAILVIFMILYQEFKDSSLAVIVLLNLPLALIGGIFAIKASSDIISIPSIIGFITLFGIATRNGILLISRYLHLEKDGKPLHERIIEGSIDRLNPILMTALTAALALIPLALGGDKPGNEIQSPMAIVILGGLLSSTLLNIFIIPSVYYVIQKRKNNDKEYNYPDFNAES
ncbi:MAG: efflux RND transporter permease subunit [Bacteroidales bacterium]|nr:efflux RND transporter permease subunit [Bacteroidales bacterium]